MKNKWLLIIAVLSVLIAAAGVQILPDEIAVHFGLSGEADRIGSKYEVFIFAALIILLTVIGIILRGRFEKQAENADSEKVSAHAAGNAKVCNTVCTVSNAVMLGIELIFVCIGYNGVQTLQGTSGELYCSVMVILCGIMFAVLGNIVPKLKMNGLLGLRTVWSMKNEEVWARSQRMGGTVLFFGGAAIILAGIILRGFPSVIAAMIIFIVVVAVAVKGSHQIYCDWAKENPEEVK